MRAICKVCRCNEGCYYIKKGKESECLDVQKYYCGYDEVVEKACNVYRKHLVELRTSLNFVFDGDGDIIDIDKCVENFRKELTE